MQNGKIWVARVRGGPTKVVIADKPVNRREVEKKYMASFAHNACRALSSGDDDAWVQMDVVTEEELVTKYSQLMVEHPAIGRPLSLIRIQNGDPDGMPNVRRTRRSDLQSGGGVGDGGSVPGAGDERSRRRVRQQRPAESEAGGAEDVPGPVGGEEVR